MLLEISLIYFREHAIMKWQMMGTEMVEKQHYMPRFTLKRLVERKEQNLRQVSNHTEGDFQFTLLGQ